MSEIRLLQNTSKEFPCVMCGSSGNVIRESMDNTTKRIKCNKCNFVYSAQDSLDAQEVGTIPDGPQELQDKTPSGRHIKRGDEEPKSENKQSSPVHIPKTPAYCFISKDRRRSEFISKRDLRKAILKWEYENINFDVFELHTKKVSAKIDLE